MAEQTKPRPASGGKTAVGRLFVLELNAGQIHSMNTDGTDKKTIVTDGRLPDGIAVDVEAGHIYWTNMGVPSENDGSIERVGRIAQPSLLRAIRLRRSSSTSKRRPEKFIGATARECA